MTGKQPTTDDSARLPECDIVMRGGTTSGIVYPGAVAEIASRYVLRSIGGTSAGAIAAIAAAAMEFGRATGCNPAAAAQIGGVTDELKTATSTGRPVLAELFQPETQTRPLFDLMTGLSTKGRSKAAAIGSFLGVLLGGRAVQAALAALAVAALGGAVMAVVLTASLAGPLSVVAVSVLSAILSLVVAAGVLGMGLSRLVSSRMNGLGEIVVANGYGLCTGRAESEAWIRNRSVGGKKQPDKRVGSLIDWLYATTQQLAGLPTEEPLTFGDLWTADHRTANSGREAALAAARAAEADRIAARGGLTSPGSASALGLDLVTRRIDLLLVTSDLSRGLAVQMPFVAADTPVYFRRRDLIAVLPEPVVDWMVARARHDPDIGELAGEDGDLYMLPEPADLPVLLGARMSMSFPVLFSAVRLHTIRYEGDRGNTKRKLVELLFSDGGITSNFPIHMFDAPFPARPTFCLNLLYEGEALETVPRPDEGAAATTSSNAYDGVFMVKGNGDRLIHHKPIDGSGKGAAPLQAFAGRVFDTARLWADNQLMDVPGYRDRIAHVRLKDGEGGQNFGMSEETIAHVAARGRKAGQAIAERFLPGATVDPLYPGERLDANWSNHRFARLRSFIAAMEVTAGRFAVTFEQDAKAAHGLSIDRLVGSSGGRALKGPPQYVGYAFSSVSQREHVRALIDDLVGFARNAAARSKVKRSNADFAESKSGKLSHSAPRPKPALRLRAANGDRASENSPLT